MTKLQKLIAAALAAPTAAERLAAFVKIDGAGLPGVTNLRERQERVKTRLRPAPERVPFRLLWTPRLQRFNQRTRDTARAHATTDASQGLSLAYSYHRHIGSLFTSQRAEIVWGYTPQSVTDWDAYAKSYGRPANYVNPAYYITYHGNLPVVVMYTVRSRRIEVPLVAGALYNHACLLDGDLYAMERHGVMVRYNLKGKVTGYAVRYPGTTQGVDEYWEHGATLDECRREYQRKLTLARAATITGRDARKARLVARLCGALACTVDDAKAVGYCRAGIDAFRSRYHLGEAATVAQLRGTGNAQVARVIEQAAKRIVVLEAE